MFVTYLENKIKSWSYITVSHDCLTMPFTKPVQVYIHVCKVLMQSHFLRKNTRLFASFVAWLVQLINVNNIKYIKIWINNRKWICYKNIYLLMNFLCQCMNYHTCFWGNNCFFNEQTWNHVLNSFICSRPLIGHKFAQLRLNWIWLS